jgi:hypothetical protein
MPHLPPAHHETSKRDSPDEIKIKEKQNKTILDSNSNLAKSITHHTQTKNELLGFSLVLKKNHSTTHFKKNKNILVPNIFLEVQAPQEKNEKNYLTQTETYQMGMT